MRRGYRHGLLVTARRSPHATFGTAPLLRRRPRPHSPLRRLTGGSTPPAAAATVCIGLGTNTGARLESLLDAVDAVRALPTTWLEDTSMLYESEPMYVVDQPRFLNAVALLRTELAPLDLLRRLKEIEVAMGRQSGGVRNGPRPIDLDILFFSETGGDGVGGGEAASWLDAGRGASWLTGQWDGSGTGDPETDGIAAWNLPLELPHPRIHERQFVLKPLFDVAPDLVHPESRLTVRAMLDAIGVGAPGEGEGWGLGGGIQGSAAEAEGAAVRVMPLREDRFFPLDRSHAMAAERQGRTFVMGILNVTPDSFSDGGSYNESVEVAVGHALAMVREGADVIDIGGESTRPDADEVALQEELQRTVPVIRRLREALDALDRGSDSPVLISIDTRRAKVAEEAVAAGADMINDVSGATFDPEMAAVMARARKPVCLMHMRGVPQTMQKPENLQYGSGGSGSGSGGGGEAGGDGGEDGVVEVVAQELAERIQRVVRAGLPRWMIIGDPGIGFAKDQAGNLQLLKPAALQKLSWRLKNTPLLVGASRKRFIGALCGEEDPQRRDWGTVATSCAASSGGVCMVRVHNVEATAMALRVMDAITAAPGPSAVK